VLSSNNLSVLEFGAADYIVIAVTHAGANAGGELIAYALP
jgi:hypothetical protein